MFPRPTAHLFCKVVDNFGDAGIAWILATGLAQDYGFEVTLFIDDVVTLQKLAPDYTETENVRVTDLGPRDSETPNLVIEVLAGTAPEDYIEYTAQHHKKPVWMIYEYLSAEDWVQDFHLKPSPHPRLDLPRTFFYPGFTAKTGGLLYRNQQKTRLNDLENTKIPSPPLKIGLFSYETPLVTRLLDVFAANPVPTQLNIPDGQITLAVAAFLGIAPPRNTEPVTHKSLQVRFTPFVPRNEFDAYLISNDINFIRGEESLTSAIMAAKPLIWHIYPQDEAVHMNKLAAFCQVYTDGLSENMAQAFITLNQAWNGHGDIKTAWESYIYHLPDLTRHAQKFATRMQQHGSALKNLVDFYQKR